MELEAIPALLGALGLGSVATQFLLGGRSRREVRSEVLAQLAVTENARWGGTGAVPFSQFLNEVRSLETASLIARVPRAAVLNYVVLAHAGKLRSQELLDQHGGPEDDETGGETAWLNRELGDLVRDSAWLMTKLAWSPWMGRATLRYRLKQVRGRIGALDEHKREFVRAGERIHGRLTEGAWR